MTSSNPKISAAEARKLRLSQALRENMKRRKQQIRGRAGDEKGQQDRSVDQTNDEHE